MTEINTIRKNVYLNIGDKDEADIMLLKNKRKEQQKTLKAIPPNAWKDRKTKEESEILQYKEKQESY